jgi:Mitochondrial ATP synthase epsilon chain
MFSRLERLSSETVNQSLLPPSNLSKWCSRGKPQALRESIGPLINDFPCLDKNAHDWGEARRDATRKLTQKLEPKRSYNRYLFIASRALRRSLKDDKRLLAERRDAMDLRFAKWTVSFGFGLRSLTGRVRIVFG